jgi:superoxide reductase
MPQLNEVYKCELCGNIVELVHGGPGALNCCSQKMVLLVANTTDAAQEKHVPVIEIKADSITVKIGSVPHPMQDEHFIEWIELMADGKVYRQNLQPGETPQATFPVIAQQVTAREHCNLHGLWSAKS